MRFLRFLRFEVWTSHSSTHPELPRCPPDLKSQKSQKSHYFLHVFVEFNLRNPRNLIAFCLFFAFQNQKHQNLITCCMFFVFPYQRIVGNEEEASREDSGEFLMRIELKMNRTWWGGPGAQERILMNEDEITRGWVCHVRIDSDRPLSESEII